MSKKTTQQRSPNTAAINSYLPFQNDFGYKGQRYFRNWKHTVYRCRESDYVMFPFEMEKMVEVGLIQPENVVRFMEMLEGDDKEMERLAMTTLLELLRKMVSKK